MSTYSRGSSKCRLSRRNSSGISTPFLHLPSVNLSTRDITKTETLETVRDALRDSLVFFVATEQRAKDASEQFRDIVLDSVDDFEWELENRGEDGCDWIGDELAGGRDAGWCCSCCGDQGGLG